jgi:hypothetical protein
MRRAFDSKIQEISGPTASTQDFPAEEDITLEYDAIDPDILDLNRDHGDIEVTPGFGDNYVGAEILLPWGVSWPGDM